MGKHPVVRILALALAVMLVGCSEPVPSADTGNDNPVFTTAAGEPIEWASLRGDWVLVNYWAEWCKPCLEEIPELNDVNEHEGITVLAVNFDGVSGQQLVDLGQRMGIGFTMLSDNPAPALGWAMPQGLPATFLVAPDGELRETLMGAQTEAGLMALMKRD
ncbi:TlpA family protein disulfide reductase [Marinobacter lacisalsi]|uniref:TlpA family protein disulfide reductase n=1 Tax=Marinobacter lacisalsi TaxID=475979 RepID=A0ABV8QI28_9GAMM